MPHRPYFWGIWTFAQNKSAAKELIAYLSQREQVETLDTRRSGYDIPPFLSCRDFKIWAEVEPPKGTVFNYPVRPWHDADTASPAPPARRRSRCRCGTAAPIPTMVAKLYSGQTIDQAIAWAKDELEGFMR